MADIRVALENEAILAEALVATKARPRLTDEENEALAAYVAKGHPTSVVISLFQKEFGRTISDETVRRAKKANPDVKSTCGRPLICPDKVEERVLQIFNMMRRRGSAITISIVRAIAKGALRLLMPSLVNTFKCSRSWARGLLRRQNVAFRKQTTSRVITHNELFTEGSAFYADLVALKNSGKMLHPSLTMNVDEFFVLSALASGTATWTRVNEAKSVSIKTTKAGFSASVCTAADGSARLLQFIYAGGTDLVHAAMAPAGQPDPDDVLQCHRLNSHFQDKDTWKAWCDKFMAMVTKIKSEQPELAKVTPILFVDCASQHYDSKCYLPGVEVMAIPPKMTHVFQPADQFIISNLRFETNKQFQQYVSDLVAVTKDWDEKGIELITGDNAHTRRAKAQMTYGAFKKLSREAIEKSWQVTGILKYLFDDARVLENLFVEAEEAIKSFNGGELIPQSEGDIEDSVAEDIEDIPNGTAPTQTTFPMTIPDEAKNAEAKDDLLDKMAGKNTKRARIEGGAMTAAERQRKHRETEAAKTQRAEAQAAKQEAKTQKKEEKAAAKEAKKVEKKVAKQEMKLEAHKQEVSRNNSRWVEFLTKPKAIPTDPFANLGSEDDDLPPPSL